MKIRQLDVSGFGKWQNQSLEVNSHFQLIYGGNEAGKSTLHHFIREILFGFPSKRGRIKDYTPKNNALYGGRITLSETSYGEIVVERFKNQNRGKATVYFGDNQKGDEDLLTKILAPLTLELFDEIFSLQQEQLINIRQLDERKLQNQLLALGLSGSQRILLQKQKFQQAQQKLYKPTGRVPELNQKLLDYQLLMKKIANKEGLESQYREGKQRLKKIQKQSLKKESQLKEAREEEQVLREQQKQFPALEEYLGLKRALSLEANLELTSAEFELLTAREQERQLLESQVADYHSLKEAQLSASHVSPASLFYQQNEHKLKKAMEQQGAVYELLAKQSSLEHYYQQQEIEYEQLKKELAVSDEQIGELPTAAIRQEMSDLATREQELSEQLSRREIQFDQQLLLVEKQRQFTSKRGQNSHSKLPLKGVMTSLLMLVSVGLLLRGQFLGSGISFLLAILSFSVILIFESKQGLVKQNTSPLIDEELEKLAQKIEKSQNQLKKIKSQKKRWAKTYQLPRSLSLNQWLYQLPLRSRLLELQESLSTSSTELAQLALIVTEKRADLAFASEWLPLNSASLAELYQHLAEFIEKMQSKEQLKTEKELGFERWQVPLTDLAKRQVSLLGLIQEELPQITINKLSELPLLLNQQQQALNWHQRQISLQKELASVFDLGKRYRLSDIEETQRTNQLLLNSLKAELRLLEEEKQDLSFTLKQQEVDGSLSELYQQEQHLAEELKLLGGRWLDFRLSEQLIQDLLNFLATQKLPAMLATASQFFQQLTDGRYIKCVMENEQLLVRNRDHQTFGLMSLSTGTRDQLYMSIRLAFIHLHSQDGLSPVIIDDGWLHYDSQRKTAFFDLLQALSKDVQIICFTSDQELKTYVEQSNQPIVLL